MKLSAGISAAPQDVSLPIFRSLKAKGYRATRWHTNAGATDVPCLSKDGDEQDLNGFLFGLQHAAPIYEKTHVGCRCVVEVTGQGLPPIMVGAFGIVQGEPEAAPPAEAVEETLPPQEQAEVLDDVELAETNKKQAPRKSASEWAKKAAPPKKPEPKKKEASKPPKAKEEKKGGSQLTKLVKKVLE